MEKSLDSSCIAPPFERMLSVRLVVIGTDSRMSPNLPRGMGKSIGGDLDVDDEGSEQHWFKPVQSLHHGFVGYQPVHT
jgi:hypothetical protein